MVTISDNQKRRLDSDIIDEILWMSIASKRSKLENKPTPEKPPGKLLNIMLPEDLINRVNAVCADKDISIQEFVTDAIIEKLTLVHKEKRKKIRL